MHRPVSPSAPIAIAPRADRLDNAIRARFAAQNDVALIELFDESTLFPFHRKIAGDMHHRETRSFNSQTVELPDVLDVAAFDLR